jgi:hypothetical protein
MKTNNYLENLNHGENVSVGDTLRYQSGSNNQHYFEIIQKTSNENGIDPPRRKVVRYLDIGYNVLVERWSEAKEN